MPTARQDPAAPAPIPANPASIDPALLRSPRVRLRQWMPADRAPFAALNADPEVMEHFPAPLDRAESDALADRIEALIDRQGWGFWAAEFVERTDSEGIAKGAFMGFVGLNRPTAPLPFAPCVEIGWRLARPFWGQGLATEGARLALRAGFDALGFHDIVAFTAQRNHRSRAVMERLGMIESPTEAFEHPSVPEGHAVRPHVLYRLARTDWAGPTAAA
ncbi:GNAT family N-acetyltransferase [Paracidovorax wautersii]|uniref:RimJ/RimL family protein N-acetyltransferase n=1 Tax=Paracidovorax wautersii TaxID=1177982 RepID=A0ABU1IES2_9BURK|nr:GNAT family N-acetyltransferase [Paracidovorax wautersii]MDR6215466.1 RimJ/RimL family protein N-acetyltransferase [Paracidovorax wautersii]